MRQLITEFPLPIFATISIAIFLSFFLIVLYWIFAIETKKSMQARAQLPFQDEPEVKSYLTRSFK